MSARLPLPPWLANGAEVSELAYRVVVYAFEHVPAVWAGLEPEAVSLVEVVEHLAVALDVDEADVLRAWAELEAVGALVVNRQPEGAA